MYFSLSLRFGKDISTVAPNRGFISWDPWCLIKKYLWLSQLFPLEITLTKITDLKQSQKRIKVGKSQRNFNVKKDLLNWIFS